MGVRRWRETGGLLRRRRTPPHSPSPPLSPTPCASSCSPSPSSLDALSLPSHPHRGLRARVPAEWLWARPRAVPGGGRENGRETRRRLAGEVDGLGLGRGARMIFSGPSRAALFTVPGSCLHRGPAPRPKHGVRRAVRGLGRASQCRATGRPTSRAGMDMYRWSTPYYWSGWPKNMERH